MNVNKLDFLILNNLEIRNFPKVRDMHVLIK